LGWSLVLPPWDAAITMFMGVFQLGLGLTLYTIGSRVVPAADLTLLSMTEVMLGPFWVWLVLGETASYWTFGGGFILLAAIAGNALSGIRHRPPAIM
jgi:drug/metabolite transporter (DMT)-like permease